jgi:uncharacterized protein with HEPN domain
VVFLRHILEALERIVAYTHGGREAFVQEPMVQDATLRNLEIIGEASKSLSPAFRASHPEVPWADMAGMRDVLIHRYSAVDLTIVWEVVENRVPALKRRVRALLEEAGDSS